jgi:putative membrane protein
MTLHDLPMVNACLNGLSAVLLSIGYYFIKTRQQTAHRNCMIAAFTTSVVFLACYLFYHFEMHRLYGKAHTQFINPRWFRPIYLCILFSHLVLAVVIVPMILMSLHRGLKARYELHKKIARWTWPLWMYVSVTGVVIYLLLYQIFPQR